MKILFYCPLKSPNSPVPSGDREFARGLREFFQEEGHDVYLVSEFKGRLFYRSVFRWLQWLWAFVSTFFKTLVYQPDVIFVYHAYYKCPDSLGWLMARIFGKPYFIFEGSYAEAPRSRREDRLGYWIHRASLLTAKRVYANMQHDIPGLQKLLAPEKIHEIAPSLNLKDWENLPAKEDDVNTHIVSVAMLRPDRKTEGIRFLIKCLARLKEEGFSFAYHHVGGGACFEEIRALCLKHELNFSLYGSVAADQVREILYQGDIFAFPGIDEGLGLVYLEAQAAGLPCVAFDNGGIGEVVKHNETGFLTPLMNEDLYCEALRKLLQNPQVAKDMGARGRHRVFSLHNRRTNYARMTADMATFRN